MSWILLLALLAAGLAALVLLTLGSLR